MMSRAGETNDHTHRGVTSHMIVQRGGVPYEVARVVCATCGRVLDERPIRRAAA